VRAQIDVLPDKYAADCTEAATDANTQAIDMSFGAKQCFGEISARACVRRIIRTWSATA
jgi:hypothetical protein